MQLTKAGILQVAESIYDLDRKLTYQINAPSNDKIAVFYQRKLLTTVCININIYQFPSFPMLKHVD